MVERLRNRPILFFNTGVADKQAYILMKTSGIPCEFRAPTLDESTPLLLVDYQRYVGIDEIKSFIVKLQKDLSKERKT